MMKSPENLQKKDDIKTTRRSDDQIVANTRENKLAQDKHQKTPTFPDITREQWFWDKAVPS